jgi:hypothetical protein
MNYYDEQNIKSADMIGLTCSLCKPVLMILGIVWIGQQITGAAHTSPLILSPPKAAPTLLDAIIQVESGGDPEAKGDYKDGVPRAVGILQIWPIMVKDCNRILGSGKYTLDDRLSPDKSIEMFNVWKNHYCKGWTDKQIATGWHLGASNKDKPDEVYWSKIQKVLGDTK